MENIDNVKSEKISLSANDKNWPHLYNLSKTFMSSIGAARKDILDILLSIEEIFVNVSRYAYSEIGGNVTVEIMYIGDSNEVIIFFEDSGIPFDPTSRDVPNIHDSPSKRSIGGLGIYIVKNLMDFVIYNYVDNKNRLKFGKKLKFGGEGKDGNG